MLLLCLWWEIAWSFTLLTNLQDNKTIPGVQYCAIPITQDQTGWSSNPPHQRWTNVTFPLIQHVQQLSAFNYEAAYIARFEVDYQLGNVMVSIVYWFDPWILYLSWPLEKDCPNVSVIPGIPPKLKF